MKNIPVRSIQLPETKLNSFDSFKIRSVKVVLDGKDMQQDLHRHDFYFILVLSKGAGAHEIDFIQHEIVDHSIFFLRPGQVHKLHLAAGSDGFLLEFNKDFQSMLSTSGAELLRKAVSRTYSKVNEERSVQLQSILSSMLEEYRVKEDGYQHAIKAALELFLIHFLRAREKTSDKHDGAAGERLYRQGKLQEFLDLLDVHISTTKQVAAYAEMLNLSPFQLNSITKNLLEKTATELIEDQIVLEAKRYLLATSNQVNQIADHLGYDDVSYFIRFFKKHTGYSPEAFRQNFR